MQIKIIEGLRANNPQRLSDERRREKFEEDLNKHLSGSSWEIIKWEFPNITNDFSYHALLMKK